MSTPLTEYTKMCDDDVDAEDASCSSSCEYS